MICLQGVWQTVHYTGFFYTWKSIWGTIYCPLYGIVGCPLYRGYACMDLIGKTIGTQRFVCYNYCGVHYRGVSVKQGFTVVLIAIMNSYINFFGSSNDSNISSQLCARLSRTGCRTCPTTTTI